MRALATPRRLFLLLPLLALAAVLVTGTKAQAQVSPLWDHYKVYEVFPNPPGPPTAVFLRDQFTQTTNTVLALEKLMNPTEKTHLDGTGQHFLINDPLLHYLWWKVNPVPFQAQVAYNNQFGGGSLQVLNSAYLLNPALKNQVNLPLPFANHYQCYDCLGQPISIPLLLTDQFDLWQIGQLFPRYFCTPVEKQLPGEIHPIVDPEQHYVCYEFQPPDPNLFPAFVRDQFITTTVEAHPGHLLCVPTDKLVVTSSVKNTWGSVKLLYR